MKKSRNYADEPIGIDYFVIYRAISDLKKKINKYFHFYLTFIFKMSK